MLSIATTLRARRAQPCPMPFMAEAVPASRRILLVDAEPALAAMVAEWLEPSGWQVDTSIDGARPALVIVDVPFPRQANDMLQRLSAAHAGTPIVVLSSTFFATVDRCGAVARQLGVAGVLPKPLQREALQLAVQQLGARASPPP